MSRLLTVVAGVFMVAPCLAEAPRSCAGRGRSARLFSVFTGRSGPAEGFAALREYQPYLCLQRVTGMAIYEVTYS